MPSRPRSHQLEKISRQEFDKLLPKPWVNRTITPDYGIDGEIEIFDEKGKATGLLIAYQIKGTDLKNLNKALSYRIKRDAYRYYKNYQIPVILIRYLSINNNIYWKWIYDVDLYGTKKTSKTIKIDFEEGNLWRSDSAQTIINDLMDFERFKDKHASFPIEFQLTIDKDSIFTIPAYRMRMMITRLTTSIPNIIAFTKEKIHPCISISEEQIFIDFKGIANTTLHYPKKGLNIEDAKKMAHDVYIGISLSLADLGHMNFAAEIAYAHLLSCSFINNHKFVSHILLLFVKSRRLDLSIQLAKKVLETDKNKEDYLIYALPAFKYVDVDSPEYKSFLKLLESVIELAKRKKLKIGAGSCHYNLANRLRHGEDSRREAIYHYWKAGKLDINYKKRAYYWKEIAGDLFQMNRYNFSERFYQKAYDIKPDVDLIALRSDALMFSGKYSDSLQLFYKYKKKSKSPEDEWCLKTYILEYIVNDLKIDSQKRDSKEAKKYIDDAIKSNLMVEEHLEKTFDKDVLCGLGWFNIGTIKSQKGLHYDAFRSFLICALVQTWDKEAWKNAVICFLNTKSTNYILEHVLKVAYHYGGEEFIQEMVEGMENSMTNLDSQTKNKIFIPLINYIQSLRNKNNDKSSVLRLFNFNGSYIQID